MKILLTESFQRDLSHLAPENREVAVSTLLKIPRIIKDTHQHQGVGLRKIHSSGIFEARIGLGLRMVFGYKEDTLILHRLGNHDEIRRYLKNL